MIPRDQHLDSVRDLLTRHPVVALIGARQVGKTTLARQVVDSYPDPATTFDLEDPADLARLTEPALALRPLTGLIVIDEIQRRPDLFPLLRVLADRTENRAKFLILGSASPGLIRQSSETLAGRVAHHELSGFSLNEVGFAHSQRLWLRGRFPRSFLAESDQSSGEWRREFIRTFLERDVPQLGIGIPSTTLRRFWTMLAHYHGQVWKASEFARSFGVADTTVRRYLDLLTATFVVRQLPPWHENIGKRQVKSPKYYLADSGLLHTLLNLESLSDVAAHPKCGASWEGFALDMVTTQLGARSEECYFWATHGGAELDLLVVHGNQRLGFEFKRTDAPRASRSMRAALSDLSLDELVVVHAGTHSFLLSERIRAVALESIQEAITRLA